MVLFFYYTKTSEKSQIIVIPRSARLTDEVGQGATRNLVFLPKFKFEISRLPRWGFARNDRNHIIFQRSQ
jgi:hypothetical protein